MAARIRKDDVVYVRSGDDKGKTGKVLRVLDGQEKVVVQGVNVVWKHLKPTQANQRGGRIQKEAPIHMAKVQPLDPKSQKGTRIRYVVAESGEKRRIAVKTGSDLGVVRKG